MRADTFTCMHGRVLTRGQTVLQECADDVTNGHDPALMAGDLRAAEVMALLTSSSCTTFDVIWSRIDALVGRSTFNHEMANAERLAAEARSQCHPADVNAHALLTLQEMAPDTPLIVLDNRPGAAS